MKSYLYNSGSVKNILPNGLKLFHILQDLHHPHILSVNNAESSHVDKVVLEIFQIKRLNILNKFLLFRNVLANQLLIFRSVNSLIITQFYLYSSIIVLVYLIIVQQIQKFNLANKTDLFIYMLHNSFTKHKYYVDIRKIHVFCLFYDCQKKRLIIILVIKWKSYKSELNCEKDRAWCNIKL